MVLSSCSPSFVACPVLCVLQLKITQSLLLSFTYNSAVLCSHQKIEKRDWISWLRSLFYHNFYID